MKKMTLLFVFFFVTYSSYALKFKCCRDEKYSFKQQSCLNPYEKIMTEERKAKNTSEANSICNNLSYPSHREYKTKQEDVLVEKMYPIVGLDVQRIFREYLGLLDDCRLNPQFRDVYKLAYDYWTSMKSHKKSNEIINIERYLSFDKEKDIGFKRSTYCNKHIMPSYLHTKYGSFYFGNDFEKSRVGYCLAYMGDMKEILTCISVDKTDSEEHNVTIYKNEDTNSWCLLDPSTVKSEKTPLCNMRIVDGNIYHGNNLYARNNYKFTGYYCSDPLEQSLTATRDVPEQRGQFSNSNQYLGQRQLNQSNQPRDGRYPPSSYPYPSYPYQNSDQYRPNQPQNHYSIGQYPNQQPNQYRPNRPNQPRDGRYPPTSSYSDQNSDQHRASIEQYLNRGNLNSPRSYPNQPQNQYSIGGQYPNQQLNQYRPNRPNQPRDGRYPPTSSSHSDQNSDQYRASIEQYLNRGNLNSPSSYPNQPPQFRNFPNPSLSNIVVSQPTKLAQPQPIQPQPIQPQPIQYQPTQSQHSSPSLPSSPQVNNTSSKPKFGDYMCKNTNGNWELEKKEKSSSSSQFQEITTLDNGHCFYASVFTAMNTTQVSTASKKKKMFSFLNKKKEEEKLVKEREKVQNDFFKFLAQMGDEPWLQKGGEQSIHINGNKFTDVYPHSPEWGNNVQSNAYVKASRGLPDDQAAASIYVWGECIKGSNCDKSHTEGKECAILVAEPDRANGVEVNIININGNHYQTLVRVDDPQKLEQKKQISQYLRDMPREMQSGQLYKKRVDAFR